MKNLAKVLFLLITFSSKYTEGAFIGQQTITYGISPPNVQIILFTTTILLHLVTGVKNAPTGAEALLAQYNSGGTIVKSLIFLIQLIQINVLIHYLIGPPYISTHSIFYNLWFKYENLSFISDDIPYIYPHNNIGGSSSALSNENLIIYQEKDGYNEFLYTKSVETNLYENIDISGGSMIMMMVFLGDNSTNVAFTFTYGINFRI